MYVYKLSSLMSALLYSYYVYFLYNILELKRPINSKYNIMKSNLSFSLLFLGYKMASRYSQEYFFQHSLMNISFSDPNEITHPNAESIPEYIRHFASAMFVNGSFWNNPNAITKELQIEGNTDDYINTYLSYINMLKTTYNLVTKGKASICFRFSSYHFINLRFLQTIVIEIIFTFVIFIYKDIHVKY